MRREQRRYGDGPWRITGAALVCVTASNANPPGSESKDGRDNRKVALNFVTMGEGAGRRAVFFYDGTGSAVPNCRRRKGRLGQKSLSKFSAGQSMDDIVLQSPRERGHLQGLPERDSTAWRC